MNLIPKIGILGRGHSARLELGPGLARTWGGEDKPWLVTMAVVTVVELIWWLAAWWAGIAPTPHVAIYLGLAFTGLAAAIGLRLAFRLSPTGAPWPAVLLGTILVGVGASAFLPLKYAIPGEIAFWLDRPIMLAERILFGTDPWILLDRLLGWATVPMDWLYGCWMPVQSLVLFSLILARPSAAKSRALIAYGLAWFLLGAVAAVLLSSAGPLFYDRLYGGHEFQSLDAMLRARGGWFALAESDLMWAARSDSAPGVVAGISAVPSVHVAISLWIYLAARELAPKAALTAFLYFLLVWIGSVQLGWHYASDGLAGAIGMLAVWQLAKVVQIHFRRRSEFGR